GLLLLKRVQAAAQKIGISILPGNARAPQEIENAFTMMAREKIGAVIVSQDPILIHQRYQIAALAVKKRVMGIAGYAEFAEAGGLMSYGHNYREHYRRAATYVD